MSNSATHPVTSWAECLWNTVHNRRFVGHGDFAVAGFISAVRGIGFRGPWGVEILFRIGRA